MIKEIKVVIECPNCRKVHEISMTPEQYVKYAIINEHVQDIFPDMSPEIREMLISGICPKCWNEMFKDFK